MTVDGGSLYVADAPGQQDNSRVDLFEVASDGFVSQFAQQPSLEYLHDGIAVGHATGETQVYVGGDTVEPVEGRVAVFDGSGSLLGTWTGADTPSGEFGCFECGSGEDVVAVDGSGALGDWASGDVYVASPRHGVVDVFAPKAGGGEEYVTRLEGVEGEPFSEPRNVTVDQANGDVLVLDGNVVDVFEPVAGMPSVYKFLLRITGTPAGAFAIRSLTGLAVDGSTGEIYIARESPSVVDEFSASGAFLGELAGTPSGTFHFGMTLAFDGEAHRLFVGDRREDGSGVVDVFGPDLTVADVLSEPASAVTVSGARLNGTVNPAGVQVSDCHFVYGSSEAYGHSVPCAQTPAEIGAGTSPVAVDATLSGLAPGVYHYRLLAADENGVSEGRDRVFGPPAVSGVTAGSVAQTTASIEASVNPDGVDTTYRVEYGPTSAYGTSVPVPDGDLGAGEANVALAVELSGLTAGALYHYRLVAVNAAGTVTGADETFTTIPPARVDGVSVTNITSSGATLRAQINPLGSDTTYQFQYGTSTSYGASVPATPADIGSGSGDVSVAQQITGLTPNTTYHVRVLASNTLGTTQSTDHTFVYDTTGTGLPDNRAYEIVTPALKNGAAFGETINPVPFATLTEDGSRLLLGALQLPGQVGSSSAMVGHGYTGELVTFSRGAGRWGMGQLAPPATQLDAQALNLVNPVTGDALLRAQLPTGADGVDMFYVRRADGSLAEVGPASSPSVPPPGQMAVRGSTADLSHFLYLMVGGGFWPFDGTAGPISLLEYVGVGNSQPTLVGVTGGAGSTDLVSVCETEVGAGSSLVGSLSVDGRTVFFTAGRCASGSGANAHTAVPADSLYARIDGSRTVPISARSPSECTSEACLGSPPSGAHYEGASADGRTAFFTSTQQLTDNAGEDDTGGDGSGGVSESVTGCSRTVGLNGCNLYEYDFANPQGHNLVAVSAGDTSGGGPRVQGVAAISSDGSHVYFVAKGVLSTVANDQGQLARSGGDNLYLFERDAAHPAGHIAFIAALSAADVGFSGSDSAQWLNGADQIMNVTPDGRFLVFTSRAALTADAAGSTGAGQVYRYDAQTASLIRLSVGERGFNDNGNAGVADASIVGPVVDHFNQAGPLRPDPTMSHDGSYVFFTSPVGLTPHALNDVQIETAKFLETVEYAQNVYEWHDGHVSLISDGRDTSSAFGAASAVTLTGTDATGANVVFSTNDPLVQQDTDTAIDYYDARICTASDPCISPASAPAGCDGEACRGAPAGAPALPGAASTAANGSGNLAQQPAGVKPKAKPKPKRRKTHKKRRRARGRRATGNGKVGVKR